MSMTQDRELRLLAEDEEDLRIISAYLQDAVVRVGDLAFLPKTRRFALLANRYCWECDEAASEAALRKRTGLHFDNVRTVKSSGLQQNDPEAVVQLLAIRFTAEDGAAGTIDLCFAGGGCLRLEVEYIDASLRDLEGPWPAQRRPVHDLGDS